MKKDNNKCHHLDGRDVYHNGKHALKSNYKNS